MSIVRSNIEESRFNPDISLPYSLRIEDFRLAMQDVYDFFYDVNTLLSDKGLRRLDDMLRPAAMSGMLSDMITASLANHARTLVENTHFNGHPDLLVQGKYADNAAQSGKEGIEVKTTRKRGGGVDMHGVREQWLCVFAYVVDDTTEPAIDRAPMRYTEVYLEKVSASDFRKNARGELGTRTASLNKVGLKKLRSNWIYLLEG